MNPKIALVCLNCPECGTPIAARPGEVAWACVECRHPVRLAEDDSVVTFDLRFGAGVLPGASGFPYWISRGRVKFTRRLSTGGGSDLPEAPWNEEQYFILPAFTDSLEKQLEISRLFFLNPPELLAGKPVSFAPVIVSPEILPAFAEFLVISVEAERMDQLSILKFELDLSPPELWVLPLQSAGPVA